MERKMLYVDMDGVMADYDNAAMGLTDKEKRERGFFLGLKPIPGAIQAIIELHESNHYDIYFLSTAPWSNPHAWSEKRLWLERHLGGLAFKKLILTHNKGLLKGHYLVDDRIANGVEDFEGYHIHFGTEDHPDWDSIKKYLLDIAVYGE